MFSDCGLTIRIINSSHARSRLVIFIVCKAVVRRRKSVEVRAVDQVCAPTGVVRFVRPLPDSETVVTIS